MNILYIVSLENIVGSGIYISQVEDLLIRISQKDKKNNIVFLYIPSLLKIGRNGIMINDIFYSKHYNAINNRYKSHNIKFIVFPFLFPMIKRWGIYLSIFTVPIFLLQMLPLLYIIVKLGKIDIIHCRSYLPGLLASIIIKINKSVKLLFDPRGFFPEEGIEHKRWKPGSIDYVFWKALERFIMKTSNSIIGLSSEFCNHLNGLCEYNKAELIYASVNICSYENNADMKEFAKRSLNIYDKTMFIYVGGLGSWNQPDVIASLYAEIEKNLKQSYLMILTNYNKEKMDKAMKLYSIDQNNYSILHVPPNEVKNYLIAADFGIMPGRRPEYDCRLSLTNSTMIGLKASEYLATGLPLLANKNLKAIKNLINDHNIGYLFDCRKDGTCVLEQNIETGDRYKNMSNSCKKFAAIYLSLDGNANKYLTLYDKITMLHS